MKSFILVLIILLTSGCFSTNPDYINIPLTDSGMPYQLPEGTYVDTQGNKHVETTKRWSVSEKWMFDYISNIK